jgi:parallel beta-helix repeat protein
VRRHGVEAWGVHSDVSVQDSAIAGGGVATGAGVADLGSDHSRDTSVVRTAIGGFRGWGINFAHRHHRRPAAALHNLALDNRISDIDDPLADDGTHEGGIWSGGVEAAIVGNRIRGAGVDGIETVGSSTRVTVVGNEVARTPVGVYLEHETRGSLFARNAIADVRVGFNVEYRYDGAWSARNTFYANGVRRATTAGLFMDAGADGNRIVDNVVDGPRGAALVLQGSSRNLIAGNRACPGGTAPVVDERGARLEDGRALSSTANRLLGNRREDACGRG